MEQFKVGDKVQSPQFGLGVIINIDESPIYPICVEFNPKRIWYTIDGRRFQYRNIDLFPINSNQTNMDELKITKQRVLDAAARCGTAKATLELLFPEAFKKDERPITQTFVDAYSVIKEVGTENKLLDGSANSPHGLLLNRLDFNYEIKGDRLVITRK